MSKKKKDYGLLAKAVFIGLSFLFTLVSLMSDILVSVSDNISLFQFESFYVYLIATSLSLYLTMKKRGANIPIVIALTTYVWTVIRCQDAIRIVNEDTVVYGMGFYIYLSSAIFLFIALFFNRKKTTIEEVEKQKKINGFDTDNVLFTRYIGGIKDMPVNTDMLVVNNAPDEEIDLIYADKTSDLRRTLVIPKNTVKGVTVEAKVIMDRVKEQMEHNETKGALLSAANYGGESIVNMLGDKGCNHVIFNESINYDREKKNTYYEITIDTKVGGMDTIIVLSTGTNPKAFFELVNK